MKHESLSLQVTTSIFDWLLFENIQYWDLIIFQVPAGPREVSEVTTQLKETLTSSSSSSTTSSSKSASTKEAYQLEQDIGTMVYSGESGDIQYPVLSVTLLTSPHQHRPGN